MIPQHSTDDVGPSMYFSVISISCLRCLSLQVATNKQLSSKEMFKSTQQGSGIDKHSIEMKHVKLRSYSNVGSDVSDCPKEENDTEFVLTDLLSFSWQIAKGMVG